MDTSSIARRPQSDAQKSGIVTSTPPPLAPQARRVQEWLRQRGFALSVVELPQAAPTAVAAAAILGCELGQIVKSLIFRAVPSGRPVLILTSGANRVNEQLIAPHLGEAVVRANAAFVRAATGFEIGGVPPVAHRVTPVTFIDADLLTYPELWAAAGTPRTQLRLTPEQLLSITGGAVIELKA